MKISYRFLFFNEFIQNLYRINVVLYLQCFLEVG